ncbi:alkaline phosphatase, partial [bacterium]|nr:alkaline phosphatase [bacterium]
SAARNNCVPTLAEMSRAALNVLRHADDMNNGIFLMIEGGAVDWANHANQMGRMIEEMNDFNAAVGAVIAWIESNSDWQETLLIVTGDHETGYLWGPGSGSPATWNPLIDNGPGALPGFRYYSNTHTNSLIPLFAKGVGSPWLIEFATGSDPVRGAYLDNTDIARVVFGYYDCTLNVELLSFSAEFMGESIELLWTTASEQDNDRFLLSRNGVVIASVPSRGNSATLQHYEWTDTNVLSATEYRYTLTAVDMDGAQFELSASTVSTTPGGSGIAHDYELGQNYPNPFNAVTSIPFTLAEGGRVTLRIYSTTGRLVATAADQTFGPGRQHVSFDARDLASGVYIYSVESNGFTARRKMVLLR